ncbi:MAG TPA: response regulator [Ruminiclostridium sp.]
MIKVLIVDDEYLLRQLIRNTIDWNSLGFEIIAEAEDGEQALEVIEETMPQLAIVDINIPLLNGLELSKSIRKNYPEIRIIILTGYGEFEYAKEAISLGVSNYILKPINKEELEKAILEVKKDILKEAEQNIYIDNLKIKVKSNYEIQKEKFLYYLITSQAESTNQKLQESVDYFELGLSEEEMVVAVIEIDNFEEKWSMEKDKQLWEFAVHNISSEIIKENNSAVAFIGSDNHIVCIINERNNGYPKDLKPAYLICEKIRKAVKQFLNFTITIGIGGSHNGFDNIYLSYKEAVFALKTKFLEGKDKVLEFELTGHNNFGHNVFIIEDKDSILINLRLGNKEGFIKQLNFIFGSILHRKLPKEISEMVAVELAFIPFTFILESNLSLEEVLGQNTDFIEFIKSCETVDELKKLIIKLYEDTVTLVLEKKRFKTSQIVEKAKTYIENNYSKESLSLDQIAESIFINSSYLSKVFKRELQFTIIEYLTNFRMKIAQKLLQGNPEMQLSELAEKVGYSDPYYFSKSFKKHFGISPSTYMQKTVKPE